MLPAQLQILAAKWRLLPDKTKLKLLKEMSPEEQAIVATEWEFLARPEQYLPKGEWLVWLFLGGYGSGKSWTGAMFIREMVRLGYKRPMIVGDASDDVRNTMIGGLGGLSAACDLIGMRTEYTPSTRDFKFLDHNVTAHTYAAQNPDQFKGPEHDCAWLDEQCKWPNSTAVQTWDYILSRLRIGKPKAFSSTTPEANALLLSQIPDMINAYPSNGELIITNQRINDKGFIWVTNGSTMANRANLAPEYLRTLEGKWGGTRKGAQYLEGRVLLDVPNSLWKPALLDSTRVANIDLDFFQRIVIAIDPAVSNKKHSDETGIIVAGLGADDHCYIIADQSLKGSPDQWANVAIRLFDQYRADKIVAEVNQGGDLVVSNLSTKRQNLPVKTIHASKGKWIRAEPIASLYEQGRVHHVGHFPSLEGQMCSWSPKDPDSPDRMDAMVMAVTELMLCGSDPNIILI